MANPPSVPSDWKAAIPAANASWCAKLLQTPGRLAVLAYQLIKWAINEDGSATDDFKAWMGLNTSDLSAPTNVSASDGTSATQVVVSWTAVSGASFYSVYRSLGSTFSTATLIGTSTTTSFTDTTASDDVVYYYWATATSSAGESDESTPDTGYTQTAGNTQSFQSSGTFVVPGGVTTINVESWGPGGNGGSRGTSPWGLPGTYTASGGGGGGGEYAVGDIPTTPAESLTITITATGAAILRSSTVLISCLGGADGGDGGASDGAGGAGGTGGSFDGSVTGTTRTAGSAGTAGSGATGGTGGVTTPVETGAGTGGNGSGTASDSETSGLSGKIKITW